MGNADTKPITIHLDGWKLLESEVGFWGESKYVFSYVPHNLKVLEKNGTKETLKVMVDPRRNGNYRATVSSSRDNFLVTTSMTGDLNMVQQFLQKRYGKPCPSNNMQEIPIDV